MRKSLGKVLLKENIINFEKEALHRRNNVDQKQKLELRINFTKKLNLIEAKTTQYSLDGQFSLNVIIARNQTIAL